MIKVILICFIIFYAYKIKTKNNLRFILSINDDNRLLIELYNYLKTQTRKGSNLNRVNSYQRNIYLVLTLKQCSLNNDYTIYDNIDLYTQTKNSLLDINANKYIEVLEHKKVDNLYKINNYLDDIVADYIRENKERILKDK